MSQLHKFWTFRGRFFILSQELKVLIIRAGAPFGFGAVLLLIAFIVACTIDRQQADHGKQASSSDAATEPLLSNGET